MVPLSGAKKKSPGTEKRGIVTTWHWFSMRRRSVVKATSELFSSKWRRLSACGVFLWLHTHMPCGCVLSNVCGEVGWRVYGYGAVGLQRRQQDEHLRLSGHQVLLSCLNESNLLSALLPSLTKQISFAACSSLLIQLPPALRWLHHL